MPDSLSALEAQRRSLLQQIFVKAMALEDATGKTSVLLTSDLVGLSQSMVATISRRAQEKHGLSRDWLVLIYSHNEGLNVVAPVPFQLFPPSPCHGCLHKAAVVGHRGIRSI